MALAYQYIFELTKTGAQYHVYAPSQEEAERCIKLDLGEEVDYHFVERKPF